MHVAQWATDPCMAVLQALQEPCTPAAVNLGKAMPIL
jgi:hypothetical protein